MSSGCSDTDDSDGEAERRSRESRSARRAEDAKAEERLIAELRGICLSRNFPALSSFVRRNRGSRLPLPWPSGSKLQLGTTTTVRFFKHGDLKRCETDYLGGRMPLSIMGSLVNGYFRYPLMLGSDGHLYAYDRGEDCLYEAAKGLDGLLRDGLNRFDPVCRDTSRRKRARFVSDVAVCESERNAYLDSLSDFRDVLCCESVDELLVYLRRNRGARLRLVWPENHFVSVVSLQSAGLSAAVLNRLRCRDGPMEPVNFLGVVRCSDRSSAFCNNVILISDYGRVFASHPDYTELLEVGDTVHTLVRTGLYRLARVFRYGNIGFVNVGEALSSRPPGDQRFRRRYAGPPARVASRPVL